MTRRMTVRGLLILAAALAGASATDAAARSKSVLPNYPRTNSRYYVVYSRLDRETLREAHARLTAMAREYHRRTSGFSKSVKRRLAVCLFDNLDDYYRAGGLKGSAGLFTGSALLAVVPKGQPWGNWPTVLHEGFHQFAEQSVGGRWPVWLNEGMAEYFAHAIWTGDTVVTGLISPLRLVRFHAQLKANRAKGFVDFAGIDQTAWNAAMNVDYYDQAWSMVHYLAHAHGAKYRSVLGNLIRDASRGRRGDTALKRRLGRHLKKVESDWRSWWLAQRHDATTHLYTKAAVATITSFLARAHMQGLRFQSADEFLAAGREGKIDTTPNGRESLWLPDRLFKEQLVYVLRRRGTWKLLPGPLPSLQLTSHDGRVFTGSFKPSASRRPDVRVAIAAEKPEPAAGK